MGKLKEKTFDIFKDYKKIILYIITFIVLYCTLMTGIITRKYDLKVGDIPKSDIKAHREIIDESATEARKKEAEEKVDKQYSLRTDVQKQSEEKIKGFFSSVEKVLAQDKSEEEKAKLIPRAPFKITDEQANKIASMNAQSTKNLESVCIDGLNKAYEAPIEDGNEQDLKDAKKEYTDFISSSDLSDSEKAIA
ncbi:MAG: phosphohydrolase, partial [Clostridium perfringens]|nr:phosphohydrolase [Clostridium perfringens]